MSDTPASPHPKPAAGWGALFSTAKEVIRNRGVIRNTRTLFQLNQPDGFDCPGCAWPDPADHSKIAEYCENGAKATSFESTAKRVTPEFFAQHSLSFLRQQNHYWLENQGRLTQPMRFNHTTNHYEPITWQQAFQLIGDTLKSLTSPDEAIFYTSGRTSNEAAFLYQLFARRFGTNNLPDCSNMCHESSGCAMTASVGVGKGTVTLEDFDHADAIFVIGQNPGTNHPRMLAELEKARLRGAQIVSINPLREPGLVRFKHPKHFVDMLVGSGTQISTHYYQVLIGGDLAALKGIAKCVLEAEDVQPGTILDHGFLKEHTAGFQSFAADLRQTDWETIETQSGLTQAELREAAQVYIDAKSVITCWAMGLTQHKYAVPTLQVLTNLMLMRGNIGRAGAGLCPVRGHSNVQGDRTMGIYEKPSPAFLDALKAVFNFEPPRQHGHDVVSTITAMAEGSAKVFIGMGGNFAAATPDTEFTELALRKCQLTVHVSTKLNRSHLVPGQEALILPCLGRTEMDVQQSGPQRVTVEDSMSQVHASQGYNPPASPQLKSEVAIVCGIAEATLLNGSGIDWQRYVSDYATIRDDIAKTLPQLFQDFNARITDPKKYGFYLGNPARDRIWKTPSGKANFFTHPIPDLTLPVGQLRLMTMRSHDQFNTTVYDMNDRYRGITGERDVIFLNMDDIHERGLEPGERVTITSHCCEDSLTRSLTNFKIVAYDIPRGCAAAYFPETNPLISKDSFALESRTPLSKFIPITLQKA